LPEKTGMKISRQKLLTLYIDSALHGRRAEFAPPLAKPHTTNPGAYLQTTSALSTLKYSGNKEKSQLDIGKWIVSTTMG
jgi:hypothetical protein